MDPSEDNDLTYPTQHYVAAKPTLSGHHRTRDSAAELCGDNANDGTRKKTPEVGMQTGEGDKESITGDGEKGSEGHVPPTKTSNTVKAIKEPSSYQTHLVPGINTEKYPYEAGDENED